MKDVPIDKDRPQYDPESPSSKDEQEKDYHNALTAHSLKPNRLTGKRGKIDETIQDEGDPVRALLAAMRRAANQYITAPIARFSDSNRKQ